MRTADVPKGSVAVGRRVRLPQGAGPPFTVFVNGVPQAEGTDYHLRAGEIVFTDPIVKEKVGGVRWAAMFFGLFGTYRKNETIDVHFSRNGKIEALSDAAVQPDQAG